MDQIILLGFALLFISTPAIVQGALTIGDVCEIRGTNIKGICKLSTDCPSATKAAKDGISPTLCGIPAFSNKYIFCCHENIHSGNSFPQPNENSFLAEVDSVDDIFFPTESGNDPLEARPLSFKSKSEEKCIEYSKPVTAVVSAVPLIPDFEESIISVGIEKCDYASVALIVGGTAALPGEFPFMAAVGYNDGNTILWNCGGTLISEYYVVTAAHCANTPSFGRPVKVRLGELHLKRDDDGSEPREYNIVDIKVHKDYKPPAKYNDIALLKLAPKVKFTKFIRPACLYSKTTFETNKTIATGWGQTTYTGDQSDILLKVTLNIVENVPCNTKYSNIKWLFKGITSTMLCAGDPGSDTCQGDSGGPLVITMKENRCIYHLVGVTSFGKACGVVPGVYTRISEYIPWIEKEIW